MMRLRQLRKEAGLTQEKLAKELGLKRAAYDHYESGIREPSVKTLIDIANYYKTSIDYIVMREGA